MTAIVRGTVPAAEFALEHVLQTLPRVRFRVERVIDSGDGAVMPLVWVQGGDREEVADALASDPTVDDVELLAELDEELLFRMQWLDRVGVLLQMITNSDATVLDAYGGAGRWQLRVLFPDYDTVSRTHEFCESHGLGFDVESIRQLKDEPAGRYGITEEQYQALVEAVERGYYSVPREVTLQELAADSEVSHQALSERLRRAVEGLVEDTLVVERFDDGN